MGYAVLHINKGSGNGAALGRHNDRTQNVTNADKEKSDLNFKVVDNKKMKLGEGKRLEDCIKDRINDGYTGKKAIRKDAVTHLNIILSGSHDDMMTLEKNGKLEGWAKANYDFCVEKYGAKNIVGFYVHRDEKTPHIHAVVVPLTNDGRLSAKEVMGDKKKLSELQTDYAEAMKNKGYVNLERGVQGSKAKHTDVNWYYGLVNSAAKQEVKIDLISEIQKTNFEPIEEIKPNMFGMISHKDHLNAINALKSQKSGILKDMMDAENKFSKILKELQIQKQAKEFFNSRREKNKGKNNDLSM